MKTTTKGQVQLSRLIFTHNWEDPASDEIALELSKGSKLFTITSGGCNTIGFLRYEPSRIYSVDINPAQTYLMELKQSAFRNLSFESVHEFFGISDSKSRTEIYYYIKKDLSPGALRFWELHQKIIKKGLIMGGRYERFVKLAGWLLRSLQGRRRAERLFSLQSLEEQNQFYTTDWDNDRWKWIFKMMFNKKKLGKKGLSADYFNFDDGASSFSESFYKRASHALKEIPISSNYFLSLYLLGHYQDCHQLPDYLQKKNFDVIKMNIDKIQLITGDSKYWLQSQPSDLFDAMSLSNICELMDESDTCKLFTEVKRTCRNSARIIFRNLMIPREVPEDLRHFIVKDELLSKQLQYSDRSFVYGKVAAYLINK